MLIALLLPVYPPRRRDVEYASAFFRHFRQAPTPDTARTARNAVEYAIPLNQRLSEALPPYVNYVVVPLFALANAGVALSGASLAVRGPSSASVTASRRCRRRPGRRCSEPSARPATTCSARPTRPRRWSYTRRSTTTTARTRSKR